MLHSLLKNKRRNNLFKNKKGEGFNAIILLVAFLFILLIGGVMLAFGGITIDWVFDEAVPELNNLGSVGAANLSQITPKALNPINNIVQSFTWFSGVIYIMAMLGLVGLSVAFRFTGNKWLIAFFFACMLMLVIASIFISNIYEDFYNDSGDVGTRLHEYTALSFLILYAPMIMCIIGFVCGIIMFTGQEEEGYG